MEKRLTFIFFVKYITRNFELQLKAEAVAQMCSVKKVLLEILQNSQESTRARVSFII